MSSQRCPPFGQQMFEFEITGQHHELKEKERRGNFVGLLLLAQSESVSEGAGDSVIKSTVEGGGYRLQCILFMWRGGYIDGDLIIAAATALPTFNRVVARSQVATKGKGSRSSASKFL